jgi:nucleoside-specific outer membrane channel protein Tsx
MKKIKMQKIALATMLACGATMASAADWSDTWISYKYQSDSHEPFNGNDIAKHTVGFTHASGYKYGSNFINIDAIKSDDCDPAGTRQAPFSPLQCAGVEGAQEIYVTFRTNFEYGKVNGTPLAFGPFKDVALTAGFDINTKNHPVSGNKRMWVLGPTFMTKLDKGFLNFSLLASQETNRNADGATGRDITFDIAPILVVSWNYPMQLGLPAKFQGFFNVVGEKGESYDGRDSTAEYFSRSSLLWDIGTGMGLKNNTVWAGVGYEYWKNKFGSPKGVGEPKTISSPMFVAEWHF